MFFVWIIIIWMTSPLCFAASRREAANERVRAMQKTMIPSVFPTIEHPFPPQYYNGTRTRPVPTNAWLSNLFYASTNHQAPTITDPYILRFMDALGDGPPGLSIAHAQTKVYGGYPPMNNVPATDVGYMINPVVADIRFSAKEWENALPASSSPSPAPMARQQQQQKEQKRFILHQQVLDWDFLCATVRLTTANGTTTATNEPHVDFPLCKGMPYVTASYRSLTPVIYTQHAFISKPPPLGSPARHFTISLNDDTHYRIYAVDKPIAWTLVSLHLLQADRAYTGTLRIAKVPNPNFESLLDDHAANWPVRSSIKYSPSSYTFDWETEGDQDETLLMYAHAHHMTSMINASTTSLRLSSASKGMMHGVVGTSWTMKEPTSAINEVTWFPTRARPDKAARFDILAALAQDIDEADYDHETNKGDNYFSGKGLQKYALLALLLNRPDDTDIRNPELALTSLEKLKTAFSLFLDNRQQDRFAYDSLYRGVVAVSGLPESMGGTGNPNAAFGHAYYNDHHYHQGYFVVTAAIIHLLDPEWRADDLKLWTDALVRDVNAKEGDPLYAPFRHWDWFAGHTWAGGIKQNGALDGRDQESVPESINFYWGAKLWGMVTGDHAMEELATLQLNIMRRTTYDYFWLLDRNPNYPVGMRRNKVMGIYFEHRTDYTTYFGRRLEFIHGIQQLPMTPMLADGFKTREFVQQEWDQKLGKVAPSITTGWAGVTYMNYALINPTDAYHKLRKVPMDDGQTRAYSLYLAATRPGFEHRALSTLLSGHIRTQPREGKSYRAMGDGRRGSQPFQPADKKVEQNRIIDISHNHHDDRYNGY